MAESDFNQRSQEMKDLLEERCDKSEFVFTFKSDTTEEDQRDLVKRLNPENFEKLGCGEVKEVIGAEYVESYFESRSSYRVQDEKSPRFGVRRSGFKARFFYSFYQIMRTLYVCIYVNFLPFVVLGLNSYWVAFK